MQEQDQESSKHSLREERTQEIMAYLQREDVQKRIFDKMQRVRAEATVTISNAASLCGFSENQLRDWDEKGLLRPQRLAQEQGQNGKSTKRRQYTTAELDKLSVIRVLMDKGFSPGTILKNVDKIESVIGNIKHTSVPATILPEDEVGHQPVNQRIEDARTELFWRYFTSHSLRLSLLLICQDIPDTTAALVLPLDASTTSTIHHIGDLSKAGTCLIGWLSRSRSFHVLLAREPSFEFSSDYRLHHLQAMKDDEPEEVAVDNTLILIDRRAPSLTLSKATVEIVQRLLKPLYEEGKRLTACFDRGMRDLLEPSTYLDGNYGDKILKGFANMIVHLGGQMPDGQDRWHFCCILLPKQQLPKETWLPMQQRSLIVRAQSKDSPHKVGLSAVAPGKDSNSLSLKAFQSGHVIYRANISSKDSTVAHRNVEVGVRSAVALPIGGENGQVVGVAYVASDSVDAFTEDDFRVLRLVGRMLEEIILTYQLRLHIGERLNNLMDRPAIVDTLFEEFLSENEFVRDMEALLNSVKKSEQELPGVDLQKKQVSFIAIDMDKQSALSNQYGDLVTRNLNREIGRRLQGLLVANFKEYPNCRLYYSYGDRFYVILNGLSGEVAREKAELLRQTLKGPYQVDALHVFNEQPMFSERMLELKNITFRLGVTSYAYTQLGEILRQYPSEEAVIETRGVITRSLDEALKLGRDQGGDVTFAWNPETQRLEQWAPKSST